jgi:hypothetical protein
VLFKTKQNNCLELRFVSTQPPPLLKNIYQFTPTFTKPNTLHTNYRDSHAPPTVGGDGLVVPSWLVLYWIAQGSRFKSQRGHLFFGISPRGEISQEGFAQGLVSPPATSRYIGSVRIISEAPLVCPNGC